MSFTCPVCFYDKLQEPARDYNICMCCGTEFGSDDEMASHAELRGMWIATGARWFFGLPPVPWNPWLQLATNRVTLPYSVGVEFAGVMHMDFKLDTFSVESQFGVAA
jgi:hypothetical protein